MFDLIYTQTFQRDLKKLDGSSKKHLEKAIEKLLENPKRFKPLEGAPNHFRIRFENYRLVYKVEGNKVWLLFVRKRDEVYRNLP